MLTIEQATKNIATYARRATSAHWQKGGAWYSEAHSFCTTLARHSGFTTDAVAGCLAALSPQSSWPDNLKNTLSMVKFRTIAKGTACYPVNESKAFSIVHEGASPEDILGGSKVRAFYANIRDPRYSQAVTIDTHAARAAFAKTTLTSQEVSFVFRPKGNAIIQQAYKNVAKRYHILPMKLQATVWLRVKQDLKKIPDATQIGLYIK